MAIEGRGLAPAAFWLADAGDALAATELIARHGEDAGAAAAALAERSRMTGNAWTFCRWRQIERLIVLLSIECAVGTIH